jgi:plasmid stabilization system protein ParE
MNVIVRPRAEKSMLAAGEYIRRKGYPDTADRFIRRMEGFTESLVAFPDKYPVCRFPHLAKRGFYCAVFERNRIFVYRLENDALVIHNVVNVRRLRR